MENFFEELGTEIIVSPDTNKMILDAGVNYCVDDACLPVKVFHGHVAWLCNKCDYIFIPRAIKIDKNRSFCPMLCGLPEMVTGSVPDLPALINESIFPADDKILSSCAIELEKVLKINRGKVSLALKKAVKEQNSQTGGFNDSGYKYKVALIGHPYNLNDRFINMDLKKKLNNLGIGVITSEYTDDWDIESEVRGLYKRPFWYFAEQHYGTAMHLFKSGKVSGIVYVSTFSCGVDSVVIELIRQSTGNFPLLILKIDEHTGEAGISTRIEAFTDMLKRGYRFGYNNAADGKHMPCGKSVVSGA